MAEIGSRLHDEHIYRSAGAPFQCLTAVPPKGSTGAELLPGCAILDRESQEAETGFEPRTIRSANSRSNRRAISTNLRGIKACTNSSHPSPTVL
ncbi:hypothetical protein T265_06093 [Opisthorchis viverrini]|uniref:Uncharacterized protein n=1 Tax=Opisthorchis viverrini TaxID=6198 RepID=A0A074ZLV3_OPIVI|nr:hypothetical protein T265_06093 [Opisthorchis viverrini]KER26732.1 hypothetical protein T265_06093 [Opisthorchis viverrini]